MSDGEADEADHVVQDRATLARVVEASLGAVIESIDVVPAGLGQRRFYRLGLRGPAPDRVIARVEPAPDSAGASSGPWAWLPEPPLEPIRGFLEAAGLPVPRSFGHDSALGVDLLEDLGDERLLDLARGGPSTERDRAYRTVASIPGRLQRLEGDPARVAAFGRRFDRALLRTKAWKLLHWAWPGLLGRPADADERASIERGFEAIADLVLAGPLRLAHRDFKAENLHCVLRDRASAPEWVMIDVQGAFLAPPEYDLVCLLRDLQVDLDEDFQRSLWAESRVDAGGMAAEPAQQRFEALSVARLAKDVAHLVHAARERGDRRRVGEIPRGLALLDAAAVALASTDRRFRALADGLGTLTRTGRLADVPSERPAS